MRVGSQFLVLLLILLFFEFPLSISDEGDQGYILTLLLSSKREGKLTPGFLQVLYFANNTVANFSFFTFFSERGWLVL